MDTPWGLVFLPDKSILLTERPGRVMIITPDSKLNKDAVAVINSKEIGEGGLLGITLHPNFSSNNFVYLYYTYGEGRGVTLNKVVRMTYLNNKLTEETMIVDNIPGSANHNGGRIKFGPDGNLYITTGDAQKPSQAQDTNSLAGKILRVTDEGKTVSDSPFNNPVYSYGHRNPQGIAWNKNGQLWSTEHGRSGIQSGLDELNRIEKGKNYGWPDIEGNETANGMETPILNSGSTNTWAPAGTMFYKDSLFFGGLRGQTLYRISWSDGKISLSEHLKREFGRIREVYLDPDNMLYITTSNNDGRGKPTPTDDRIIRINPEKL